MSKLRFQNMIALSSVSSWLVSATLSGQVSKLHAATGDEITQQAAREEAADYFVEIEFVKGSPDLSPAARQAITALINRGRSLGTIQDLKVIAWADEEYPSAKRGKLKPDQRNLATRRNTKVKEFVNGIDRSLMIETYNMAETPGVLSKWLNTTDSRLKQTMVAAGLPTTANHSEVPSKASHAVILLTIQ